MNLKGDQFDELITVKNEGHNDIGKSKHCDKFSIENILGLNCPSQSDDVRTKLNRLELMDFCQKGNRNLVN